MARDDDGDGPRQCHGRGDRGDMDRPGAVLALRTVGFRFVAKPPKANTMAVATPTSSPAT
jgi:hypothetical protein